MATNAIPRITRKSGSELRRNINPVASKSPTSQATGLRIHEPNETSIAASVAAPEATAISEATAKTKNGRRRPGLLDGAAWFVTRVRLYSTQAVTRLLSRSGITDQIPRPAAPL